MSRASCWIYPFDVSVVPLAWYNVGFVAVEIDKIPAALRTSTSAKTLIQLRMHPAINSPKKEEASSTRFWARLPINRQRNISTINPMPRPKQTKSVSCISMLDAKNHAFLRIKHFCGRQRSNIVIAFGSALATTTTCQPTVRPIDRTVSSKPKKRWLARFSWVWFTSKMMNSFWRRRRTTDDDNNDDVCDLSQILLNATKSSTW